MPAKPITSPLTSKSQYKVNRKMKPKDEEKKEPLNKKLLLGVLAIIVFTAASSIYGLVRTIKSTGSENTKSKRPSIAGLDIPREIMDRVQRLKNTQDRENVIKEWAASQNITFSNRKDGAYIATRDGQEYVIREADPDFTPETEEEKTEGQEPKVEEPSTTEDVEQAKEDVANDQSEPVPVTDAEHTAN